MSQKVEKPTLSGQRIRHRKRDEKEKYDPAGFRDAILQGLNDAGENLDAVSKFLDAAGSKLDYRRYGEALFDILIAGGLLAPGGLIQDAETSRTKVCLFGRDSSIESVRGFEQVFIKLIRRYKYLERMLEDEMKKVLLYLRGFTEEDRLKLARISALWLSTGTVPPSVLNNLLTEHMVKDGLALSFLLDLCTTWKQECDISALKVALKKAGLENKLLEFFPANKRTNEHFNDVFKAQGLNEIIEFRKQQVNSAAKRELQRMLSKMMSDNEPLPEIIASVKDLKKKNDLQEHEVVTIFWTTVMGAVEWNKKEELVADQALRHLKNYCGLFKEFTNTAKSQLVLLIRIQEYCYDNMNFMKTFQKIVLLFYKTEVLAEEVILKWYKEAHSTKGKSVFLEQMAKFVEWLQTADEESDESGDDD